MFRTLAIAVLLLATLPSADVNGAVVYGGGTETGSRYNAGAGAITYMNCFTALGAGQSLLTLDQVEVGIRRIATAGNLLDVGLNVYAADMTYDGTNFGRGTNNLIFSTTTLGPGAASTTQLVTVKNLSTVLNLETVSNAGLGGWWIGVEFTGANSNNAANGWRVNNAPATGASINGFGIFNNAGSGVFQSFFGFGTPAGSAPSRFLVNVDGNLSSAAVPEPSGLTLIGLAAGAVGMVRRRRSLSR